MNIRDVLKALLNDGWYEAAQAGSHKQLKHAVKKGA
jgi:predicted RNA binding protein YcfA (HicA-like mRNA interferase family)